MAENLKHAGLDVTLVEAAEQILGPLDGEMARMIENVLADKGIKLVLGDKVEKFSAGKPMTINLAGGGKFTSDMVILAIGVKPEVKLAVDAGLALGSSGGIAVDAELRTSDPAIFAVGDAIEVKHLVNGQAVLIPPGGTGQQTGADRRRQYHGPKFHLQGHPGHFHPQGFPHDGGSHRG